MKLGCALPQGGTWATPENQIRVAQCAEALGYASLWVFQRLLYPLEPRNAYPTTPGAQWPRVFERVADPIVTLAYVAGTTSRIRLGTAVLLMPYYSPIMLAKQLATLDRVSGGRLHVGLGVGWSEDEYEAVGTPFARRGARADEFLQCLRAIWTEEVVDFRGRFYRVPRARVEPKPVQTPHPPVTVGGYSDAAVTRAVTLADGYLGGTLTPPALAAVTRRLRGAAEAAGRDPGTLHVICRVMLRLHALRGGGRRPLADTLAEIRTDIERYAAAGATEVFLDPNFDPQVAFDEGGIERCLEVLHALAPRKSRGSRPEGPA